MRGLVDIQPRLRLSANGPKADLPRCLVFGRFRGEVNINPQRLPNDLDL
jgi:hypothetical protein